MKYALGGIALTAALVAAPAAQAGSTGWVPLAQWEMNETSTATVLRDATATFPGALGKKVTPTDRRFHKFPPIDKDVVAPAAIDRVPDNDMLDPGTRDFKVQLRFLWSSRRDMNFVQKGQGSPAGGMFKIKTSVGGEPLGGVKCLFRGSEGDSQVTSWPNHAALDDGQWHRLACTRDGNGVTMFIDGIEVDNNPKQPGTISNNWPVAIGGNTYCEDTATEENDCNYFNGQLDYVRFYT